MSVRLVRPSVWRVVGFIVAAAIVFAVIAGNVLYANSIIKHRDSQPTPAIEYLRLFIVDVTFWGPMALLAIWQISLPLILVVGALAASIRRQSDGNGR